VTTKMIKNMDSGVRKRSK